MDTGQNRLNESGCGTECSESSSQLEFRARRPTGRRDTYSHAHAALVVVLQDGDVHALVHDHPPAFPVLQRRLDQPAAARPLQD